LLASYRVGGSEPGTSPMYPTPQVLCSGTGAATNSTDPASVGTCNIPGGLLAAGDRIEIRYDLEHAGTAGGFSFEVRWGATAFGSRDAAVSETLATGRAEAGITASGAQLSFQSWGSTLSFSAGASAATDAYDSGITIEFMGRLAGSGDTLTLRNFTVIRFP
jgi:hypothetical protein